jgi:hypothetical protein
MTRRLIDIVENPPRLEEEPSAAIREAVDDALERIGRIQSDEEAF